MRPCWKCFSITFFFALQAETTAGLNGHVLLLVTNSVRRSVSATATIQGIPSIAAEMSMRMVLKRRK